jgi:hypothetical protein
MYRSGHRASVKVPGLGIANEPILSVVTRLWVEIRISLVEPVVTLPAIFLTRLELLWDLCGPVKVDVGSLVVSGYFPKRKCVELGKTEILRHLDG